MVHTAAARGKATFVRQGKGAHNAAEAQSACPDFNLNTVSLPTDFSRCFRPVPALSRIIPHWDLRGETLTLKVTIIDGKGHCVSGG